MKFRSLLNKYQDSLWYSAQTIGEAQKPLRLWNETLLIVTYLTVRGHDIDIFTIILVYIAVMIVAVILGMILTKLGVVAYVTELSNRQNPQLKEILERVKRIEQYHAPKNYDG